MHVSSLLVAACFLLDQGDERAQWRLHDEEPRPGAHRAAEAGQRLHAEVRAHPGGHAAEAMPRSLGKEPEKLDEEGTQRETQLKRWEAWDVFEGEVAEDEGDDVSRMDVLMIFEGEVLVF